MVKTAAQDAVGGNVQTPILGSWHRDDLSYLQHGGSPRLELVLSTPASHIRTKIKENFFNPSPCVQHFVS